MIEDPGVMILKNQDFWGFFFFFGFFLGVLEYIHFFLEKNIYVDTTAHS